MTFFRQSWPVLLLVTNVVAGPRPHTVLLGKWRTVKVGSESGQSRELKVRDLIVDGRSKEYTTGLSHDVTDSLFVVQRVYRLNDALSDDQQKSPQWIWRLGGWISVNRRTGRVVQVNLPIFDPESSSAAWYQDYAAYCGRAGAGARAYLVVWQLGRRKPVLRRQLTGPGCAAPTWERDPSRVTFIVAGEKNTFMVPKAGEKEGPE